MAALGLMACGCARTSESTDAGIVSGTFRHGGASARPDAGSSYGTARGDDGNTAKENHSVCDGDAGPNDFTGSRGVPADIYAAVGKVKNLLVGMPPSEAEVRSVFDDRKSLYRLAGQWMESPQYREKMLRFLSNAFQQTNITYQELVPQYLGYPLPPFQRNQSKFVENLSESFGRTAMELIAEGKPFTSTMTTRRFMMTPALLSSYALLEANPVPDTGFNDNSAASIDHELLLESAGPIPLSESVDPSSPNYLHFYAPAIATPFSPGCPTGTITYPAPTRITALAGLVLEHAVGAFDYDPTTRTMIPAHKDHFVPDPGFISCSPPGVRPLVEPSDFTSWRMISIRPPRFWESVTNFSDLPALRTTNELVANIPRVGFFTTLSFLGQWATNKSNLARVTANQTLIVALGMPIDTSNMSSPKSLAALDSNHAAADSDCFACHESLDPMRQFFRQTYTLYFSRQDDRAQVNLPGQFAFQGVSSEGTSIFKLGTQLAGHPFFAKAWVQRLCTYANSAPCSEEDMEFKRLVNLFVQSNYSWNALVQALFSSPFVTGLSAAQGPRMAGERYPMARQSHLCAALSNRLGIPDVCGLDANTAVPPDLAVVRAVASTWPSDQYARGNATPVLANSPSLFTRSGLEQICSAIAGHVVDNGKTGQFLSTEPDLAMSRFVTNLMGLSGGRGDAALVILKGHFLAAQDSGETAKDALKSTFVLACVSPYVAAVGL